MKWNKGEKLSSSEEGNELCRKEFYGEEYEGTVSDLKAWRECSYDTKMRYYYDPYVEKYTKLFRGKKTLVLGCGIGHHVWSFGMDGILSVYGCDISSYAVRNSIVEVRDRIVCCDIKEMPYGENSFHNIIAINVIEHVPFNDLEKAIKEIFRVCTETFVAHIPTPLPEDGPYLFSMNEAFREHMVAQEMEWWEDIFEKNKTKGWNLKFEKQNGPWFIMKGEKVD